MKLFFLVGSYLIGAVPTGYLFFRLSGRGDIRGLGSGSTGATNVLRLRGWRYAVPVLVIDVLKGFGPAFLALRVYGDISLAAAASWLAAVGHCYPVYIRFRGGKGVAVTMGAFAALSFRPFLLSLAVFLFTVAATRYVSVGSLLAALTFPIFVFLLHGQMTLMAWSFAFLVLVAFQHRENIRRLLRGQERKLREKAL